MAHFATLITHIQLFPCVESVCHTLAIDTHIVEFFLSDMNKISDFEIEKAVLEGREGVEAVTLTMAYKTRYY
jgi:hypothetical protein